MIARIKAAWKSFQKNHLVLSQFIVFFLLSNGVTVMQMVLMPILKSFLDQTQLIDIGLQFLPIGKNFDGSQYFVFNYAAGGLPVGGGGLSYFLSVQLTMAVAQVVNFFLQRNITFKSNGKVWKAAFWYLVAYLLITVGAAAAQGLYKAPIYTLLIYTWGWGAFGETAADVITMIINAAISFWVFFPIFRVIFKNHKTKETAEEADA